MNVHHTDLTVVGAGPAGAALALSLAHSGMQVTVVEKARFPREMICGDALSGQVNNVMKRMPDQIYRDFLALPEKTPSWGIRFYSPGMVALDLPFVPVRTENQEPPGYICPRKIFDDFLFQRLKRYPSITLFEGEAATSVNRTDRGIELTTSSRMIRSKVIAGADGMNSLVRSSFSGRKLDKSYHCMAVRAYFTGITGFHPENFIELIYLKELVPAYFWIFPEVGGEANVGLGLPYDQVVKKKIPLKTILEEVVQTHPLIAPRFRNAVRVSPFGARGLALARNLKDLSGDRFLLVGDAALLVDPFTGEGIGFAMASAESAAAILKEGWERGDFSRSVMQGYDRRISRRMGMEHSTSAALQRFMHIPGLFDKVVRKAAGNKALQELLASAFTNDNIRKKLGSPLFYARLLL